MKKSKIWLFIFAFFICLCNGMVAEANGEDECMDEVRPWYVYIQSHQCTLSISDSGKATCNGTLIVRDGMSCNVTITLQRKEGSSWKKVTSWTKSGVKKCVVTGTYTANKGHSYRVKMSFNCGTDSGTVYSGIKEYQIKEIYSDKKDIICIIDHSKNIWAVATVDGMHPSKQTRKIISPWKCQLFLDTKLSGFYEFSFSKSDGEIYPRDECIHFVL